MGFVKEMRKEPTFLLVRSRCSWVRASTCAGSACLRWYGKILRSQRTRYKTETGISNVKNLMKRSRSDTYQMHTNSGMQLKRSDLRHRRLSGKCHPRYRDP